jgi:CRP/FNR family transcriptional regulator, cyclic AMP receptor protein
MPSVLLSLLGNPSFQTQVKYITCKFNPNQKILEQGKMHPSIYIIKSGKVRVTVKTEKNQDPLLLHPGIVELGPDEIFGEFGLIDDLPASADVTAIIESELIEIDIPSLRTYLETNPQEGYRVFLDMLQSLVKRLRHADKAIVNLYAWGIKAHQLDQHLESEE